MHHLIDYALFLIKTLTIIAAILLLLVGFIALLSKDKTKEKLRITKLNRKFADMAMTLHEEILPKKELKALQKTEKKKNKKVPASRKRIFVLHFVGDVRATQVESLREEVTAVLTVATPKDEVVICVDSGGGLVHSYGLCASQLQRLRQHNIPLTVAIDKVAASGGYMMACTANKILAAPFSIVGSVGVLMQLPNFNRYLRRHEIEFEQVSAGEYKRTLTLFGENTSKARQKVQAELDETLVLFKDFIHENRPQVDIDLIATGEYWLGTRALELKLVDQLITSDDYLLKACESADIFTLCFARRRGMADKLSSAVQMTLRKIFHTVAQEQRESTLV